LRLNASNQLNTLQCSPYLTFVLTTPCWGISSLR